MNEKIIKKKNRGKNLISKSLPRISLIISIQTLFLDCRLRLLNILLVFNYLYSREKQIENGYLTNI